MSVSREDLYRLRGIERCVVRAEQGIKVASENMRGLVDLVCEGKVKATPAARDELVDFLNVVTAYAVDVIQQLGVTRLMLDQNMSLLGTEEDLESLREAIRKEEEHEQEVTDGGVGD